MNTNSRGFNYFFFLTVIFFVLILPAISLAQWKLALPKFVLDGTNQDSEGLGDKARKILKDEIRSTGMFAIIEGTTNKDLGQKNLAIKSPEIETFDINLQALRQVGVKWLVKTNYEVNKEGFLNFTFRLYDIGNNRFFIGKRYTTSQILLQKVIRRYTDELVFQITGKRGTAEISGNELELKQGDKVKKSSGVSLIERSITNHINQFKSCGFNRNEIKVEKNNLQSSNIIAYIIYGSTRNLKCLISKKSKINIDLKDNNLIFFQSLHDHNYVSEHPHLNLNYKEVYPLEEGLIKLDDRLVVFAAPGSEGGITDITKVSSDSVLVKVSYPTNNKNYLVSLPALKLDNVSLNRVNIIQRINKSSKNPRPAFKAKLDNADINRVNVIEKTNKSSKNPRPAFKVKLDNTDINRVNVIEKTNKSSKKTPTGLTAQEDEFNMFKQESEREIFDLRTKIKSLRNQLAHLKSDQTKSKQQKTLLISTEKSSKLSSPESSKQKQIFGNIYKTAKKKEVLQSDSLSSSTEINPAKIVVSTLFNWVKAWETRNSSLYLSFYSKNFKDPKRSRSEWEAYRRKTIENYLNISLQVSSIKTYLTKKNTISTSFIQRFKSNKFSDVGLKELVWEKDSNGWKIIKESWEPRQ